MTAPVPLTPFIQEVVNQIQDRQRLAAGIRACTARERDFASTQEMLLAGIAMIPEAREMVSDAITRNWAKNAATFNAEAIAKKSDFRDREFIVGGGFHAAVYAANRVRTGFRRPIVLEQNPAGKAGGAFAMSLNPVFRLNSRSRPGTAGLPDQDKALNFLPGGLLQPAMISSEEYPTNADMAWLIRLTLAQYAVVYPGVSVTEIRGEGGNNESATLATSSGDITVGRVVDARGIGTENQLGTADGERVLTFSQLMTRMGGMFPLRGIRQVAVIGGPDGNGNGGDSGKCAVESMLGIAPGHTSAIGLDYIDRADWYTELGNGQTCDDFRQSQRGRYIRIAQYLDGNVSNPSTRLRVIGQRGYKTPMPDGVLVNDRTYDMAVLCTGSTRADLNPQGLSFFAVRGPGVTNRGTVLATRAAPFPYYRIGPCADIPFSDTEIQSGITDIPANKVAIFRLAPRTAALAGMLPGVGTQA